MKVCIYGAGAIGGWLGIRLAQVPTVELAVVARGATLAALRSEGWSLQDGQREWSTKPRVSDEPAELGVQDLVIVAVKATALSDLADRIAALLGPHTMVMAAMNGLPWWFGQGLARLAGQPLQSIDPQGKLAQAIPLINVMGCVVHASASVAAPGRVLHKMGNELIIGEPTGELSKRAHHLQELLQQAGFAVRLSNNIQYDIWYKLWGNMTMNPVSALTGATTDRILKDELVRRFCSAAMNEAAAIGAALGLLVAQSSEDRHNVTRKLGVFRTSMLQDVDAKRPLELDALVGAVHELGHRLGIATPTVDALFGLTRLFGQVRGLYPG